MMHTQIKLTLEKIISFPQFVGFFASGWDFFFGFGIFFLQKRMKALGIESYSTLLRKMFIAKLYVPSGKISSRH